MGDEINLKIATRQYIEAISTVHDSIRKLFQTYTNKCRNRIESAHSKFKEKNNCKTDYLEAVHIENDKIEDKIALLLDWDEVRINLQKKNRKLTNLSKRYITGLTNISEN